VRVFLGITGASGAPYAARLLEALHGAGAEVGVAASSAGVEVLATELYGDRPTARRGADALVAAVPPSSRRRLLLAVRKRLREIDAYVICPCSMSTVGTIATGAMRT